MRASLKLICAATILTVSGAFSANAAVIDTIQTPTNFFVPNDAAKFDLPWYRGGTGHGLALGAQDWSWTHNPIAGVTTAVLQVSAFDVDFAGQPPTFPLGEKDLISAFDVASATWVPLGFLSGANEVWAFTNFAIPANLIDDIATGLAVRIQIDTLNEGWLVTLAKSSLSTDGLIDTNPNPGAVPLPGTALLMGSVIAAGASFSAWRRRKQKVQSAA